MWRTKRFVFLIVVVCQILPAAEKPQLPERFRGGTVEWARLKHKGEYWNRHAESDDAMLSYMRSVTTLNIESVWKFAPAGDLNALIKFPFIFADTLRFLTKEEQANLTEYLKRGGFLFIDACCNDKINPTRESFLTTHLRILREMLPELEIEEVDPGHEVFSIYFKMHEYPPQSRPGGSTWMNGPTNPLRLLKLNGRPVGLMSMSGLQCGWARVGRQNPKPFVQMMTNIYIYAITH